MWSSRRLDKKDKIKALTLKESSSSPSITSEFSRSGQSSCYASGESAKSYESCNDWLVEYVSDWIDEVQNAQQSAKELVTESRDIIRETRAFLDAFYGYHPYFQNKYLPEVLNQKNTSGSFYATAERNAISEARTKLKAFRHYFL